MGSFSQMRFVFDYFMLVKYVRWGMGGGDRGDGRGDGTRSSAQEEQTAIMIIL